jgi:hypothetical protein
MHSLRLLSFTCNAEICNSQGLIPTDGFSQNKINVNGCREYLKTKSKDKGKVDRRAQRTLKGEGHGRAGRPPRQPDMEVGQIRQRDILPAPPDFTTYQTQSPTTQYIQQSMPQEFPEFISVSTHIDSDYFRQAIGNLPEMPTNQHVVCVSGCPFND